VQDLPRIETSIKIAAVSYAGLTAELVSAYVSNNPIRPADLSELIASVHKALSSLGASAKPAVEQVEKPTPAQIRKSVTPKGIVSFLARLIHEGSGSEVASVA
jgi:predicted transcriptional regulator